MNETRERLQIGITGVPRSEADRLATELQGILARTAPNALVSRERGDPDAMELGSIIAIVVGSAAATAIAKGVQTFIGRMGSASISIGKDGEVQARNLTSADAVKVTETVMLALGTH